LTGGQEAAGSSPVTRTKNPNETFVSLGFFFLVMGFEPAAD
jgi:hypothetical protein